jgi:hypothetical protein
VLQFGKENPLKLDLPAIKLEESEDVTEEAVSTSLKRAISRFSTLQAHDGHWPGDYAGPMFPMPGLVLPLAQHFVLKLVHARCELIAFFFCYSAYNTICDWSTEHCLIIRTSEGDPAISPQSSGKGLVASCAILTVDEICNVFVIVCRMMMGVGDCTLRVQAQCLAQP